MNFARRLAMGALATACRGGARAFEAATEDPRAAQDAVARQLSAAMARTDYGRAWGLSSKDDLRARLPVVEWSDLAPWMVVQRERGGRALCPETVLSWGTTSGSSGRKKEIPLTRGSRAAFAHLFRVWASDLLDHGPARGPGKLWLLMTPPVEADGDDGDDRVYLEPGLRTVLSPFLLDMPPARRGEDVVGHLATHLERSRELAIISVWSPTLLNLVLDRMDGPGSVLDPATLRARWPHLRIVSCWADGNAAPGAERLRARLPGVLVQGKGLLATEAPVTVPLVGLEGGVPLIDRVLVELEGDDGTLRGPADWRLGDEGNVVLSVPSGICRYRLGDRVVVVPGRAATPGLRLLGRAGTVDLAGEKLSEALVAAALAAVLPRTAVGTLIPRRDPDRYLLLTDAPSEDLAGALEAELNKVHHYKLARRQGQLAPVEVVRRDDAGALLLAAQARAGIRPGDAKPSALWLGKVVSDRVLWGGEGA